MTTWPQFSSIPSDDDWFETYQITPNLFVFYEPRHFEETAVSLLIGGEKAVLIDTGCGIGDLRKAVRAVTAKPIMVVNTHTHPDHLGANEQFDEVAMFDHPVTRRAAESGVPQPVLEKEILAEHLVTGPWPRGFDPQGRSLPPISVNRWLKNGERVELGDRELLVIPTPGEAPDHICLLDKTDRILFCGDILLHGPVWTHLEGGCLNDLVTSYRRLMDYFDDFDHLMPGHNEPWLDKDLLPAALAGAEQVLSGQAQFLEITDPWKRRLREYSFGRFSILTSPAG